MTEWISIKDRLPEDLQMCFILSPNGAVDWGLFVKSDKIWIDACCSNNGDLSNITHWMPMIIPEPLMTDIEKFFNLMKDFGIPDKRLEIKISRGVREIILEPYPVLGLESKIVGYSGFFISVRFDIKGKFIGIGIRE